MSCTNSGPFRSFGEQMQAVARSTSRATGGLDVDQRLLQVRAPAGGSEQVPADGGFLVQPEFATELVTKVYNQGAFLSRATHFPVTAANGIGVKIPGFDEQSRVDGSRWGGVKSYWSNEADTVTASKPRYRMLEIALKRLYALSYATDELISDTALLGAALETAFVNEFKFKAEYGAFFGSGSGQMLGMLNSGNNALITVAKQTGQQSGSIVALNIQNMYASMWPPSRSRACWFVHGDVEQLLPGLTLVVGDAGSQIPLFQFTHDPDNQPYNLLYGRPVIPMEAMPAVGTLGDIVFCDPSQYLFADKDGIAGTVSMHIRFLTDEGTFRFVWRIDGMPMWHTTVTPFAGTAVTSPYVALAARP